MLKYFENIKLIKGNTSFGLHLKINGENDYSICMVEVNRKKDSLDIISKNNLTSIQEIKDFNKSDSPVNITITGKGILSKTINASSEEEQEKAVNRLFPNISIQDFYVQKNQVEENSFYISIIRKSLLDPILEEFDRNKIFVSNLTINPFVVQNILPFIEENIIDLPDFSIKINEHKIQEILNKDNSKSGKTYSIGNSSIEFDYIVPYACAISFFINATDVDSNLNDLISLSRDEYTSKQLFTYGGWLILLVALFILLFNYLFFMNYQDKRDVLSNKLQSHKNLISQLTEYKTELDRKNAFSGKNKILSSSRISYYADQLGFLLPKEITLSVINIFPLEKRLKSKQEAIFAYDKIKVEGITQSGIVLNNWIKELKALKWIKRIEITGYSQENINTNGEFSLEIILNTNN